ncbi:aldo/keto reductase [Streptomyces sp. NPDC005708]|uniref:aldo/keto reductase n=1 Tax=Streptomyces sp. NPDC005708 TaxID=3154564 RepID=UPI0033D656FA
MSLELRPFGRTGLLVAELALGTLTFGRETSEAESRQILDAYIEHGGNLLDTADVYGESETILGRILGARRDEILIATKVGMPPYSPGAPRNNQGLSRHHIRNQIEASLRRLSTDHVDVYQLHCWDPQTPPEETLSTLDDLVRAGKVRYIGLSNFAGWQVAGMLATARLHGFEPPVALSPQYSLLERGYDRDLVGVCEAEGLAVLPYSPLGGGILTGKYRQSGPPPSDSRAGRSSASTASVRRKLGDVRNHAIADAVRAIARETSRSPAQVALNWVSHRPTVTAPIIGARSLAQLQDNLGAGGWTLDPAHRQALDEVSKIDLGYPHDWLQHYGLRGGPKPDREITGVS